MAYPFIFMQMTQIYVTFKVSDSSKLRSLEHCIQECDEWMVKNRLKGNGDKTIFQIMGTRQQRAKLDDPILSVGECQIKPSEEARNLGVVLDSGLTLKSHITGVSQKAYHHLHNINIATKYLTEEATTVAVHAFITSRLNYSNALYYGLPDCDISRLQRIQNSAAYVLKGRPKRKWRKSKKEDNESSTRKGGV